MREKLIAANWKMYKNPDEARTFIEDFIKKIPPQNQKNIFIFPSAICIDAVKHAAKNSNLIIGAQNIYPEKEGAFTGETSPAMIKQMGCHTVLIGHSERRSLFGETNEFLAKKIKAVQELNLVPMYCVGESLQERKSGKTFEVLKTQLTEGLKLFDRKHLILAYEPVWAIGTGEVATPEQAQEAHKYIREQLKQITGQSSYKILYGGSVKPENAPELIKQPDIDGFLVGGASLKVESFAQICQSAL
jgi:triosephosphate isomerase